MKGKELAMVWGIIGVIFVVLGLSFYWYELRPANIRKECTQLATEVAMNVVKSRAKDDPEYQKAAEKDSYQPDTYKFYFKKCLTARGLKE